MKKALLQQRDGDIMKIHIAGSALKYFKTEDGVKQYILTPYTRLLSIDNGLFINRHTGEEMEHLFLFIDCFNLDGSLKDESEWVVDDIKNYYIKTENGVIIDDIK